MSLTLTSYLDYVPTFNIKVGDYEDVCPFEKNDTTKNKPSYICGCGTSYPFNTRRQWLSHVHNCRAHKKWVSNFGGQVKIVKELNEALREEKVRNGLLRNQIIFQKRKMDKMMIAGNKIRDELQATKEKYTKLKERIHFLENYAISVSDSHETDEYQDCEESLD